MEILDPQQLATEGQAEYQRKEYLSAARRYKAAADGFSAMGDHLKAAEMENNCSVAYLMGGNAQAAHDSAAGTDEIFALAGDKKQQAMALGNQAAAFDKLNQSEKAIELYSKSAELLGEMGEFELRATVLQALSTILLRKKRFLEAYATMRTGVMDIKKPTLKQRLLKSLVQIPYKLIR